MARPSILLMLAGGAALLIVLVVLYQSTRSEAVPIEPGTTAPQARRSAEPTPAPTAPTPSATPSAPAPVAIKPAPDRWAPAAPALPVAPIMPDTGEGSSNDGLHFGVQQHHAQIAAVEPQVRECVAKANVAGIKATGTATLTYVVSKRGDKFIVEDTSFDGDGTTIQHDGLVECLHQTAKHMKYEGLPRKATSIVVTRSVKLEQGALAEHKFVTFSYLQ